MSKSLLLAVGTLIGCLLSGIAHGQSHRGIASVIDGDTLEIHGQRIRLHGIDAPESAQACRDDQGHTWRCGQEAALALADHIDRRPVACRQTDIDRYQRIVAVCQVGDEDLNAWMVRQGHAVAYRAYSQEYVDEEAAARQAKAGIWRGEFVMPARWRQGTRLANERGATGDTEPTSAGGDRDCGDFRSWREAQVFYEQAGSGDPHRLDGDKDGIACEGLR